MQHRKPPTSTPLIALALCCWMAAPGAQTRSPFAGQTRARQGAVVIGEVVDAATGRGVDRAIVRLRGGNVSQVRVTDSRGRYYFTAIPAGEFQLTATRDGYFAGEYGRLRAAGDGLPVQLGSGQWFTGARIDLWRAAIIHGVVVDEANEPVIGVRVYAHRRTYLDGKPQLIASGWELTDDQGAYRLAGLLPGDYFVSVGLMQVSAPIERIENVGQTGQSEAALGLLFQLGFFSPRELGQTAIGRGPMFSSDPDHVLFTTNSAMPPPTDERGAYAYPRQFFPASPTIADAQPINVKPSEERAGISFQIRPVLTRRVSGVVIADGKPVPDQLLRLLDENSPVGSLGSEVALTVSGRDGSFTFAEVPPGRYVVEARGAQYVWRTITPEEHHRFMPNAVWKPEEIPAEDPKLDASWSRQQVEVASRHITGLELIMQRGIPVTGTVVFDGPGPKIDPRTLTQIPVLLDPISDPTAVVPAARLNPSGAFVFPGVMPGRYAIRLGAPLRGWTIRSITADGTEVGDTGFAAGEAGASVRMHITVTTRGARLVGYVRDTKAQYVRGATVVVLTPTSSGALRLRSARVPALSPFLIDSLPPGEHLVVAMDEATSEGWQSPERLRDLRARAMRIVVRESEIRLLDLTLR